MSKHRKKLPKIFRYVWVFKSEILTYESKEILVSKLMMIISRNTLVNQSKIVHQQRLFNAYEQNEEVAILIQNYG